jgi:SET domain-containing protein
MLPKKLPKNLIGVRKSDIHGRGAFAACDLPANAALGEYAGRRYDEQEALAEEWDNRLTYLFVLSNGTTIDGAQGGNATRHLNHACDPNCEAVEDVDAAGRIVLNVVTTKPVVAGSELFLDYRLVIDETDQPSDYPCRCGTPSCRGTMAAPVEA